MVQPPAGYDILRQEKRYFPVRVHLSDPLRPGTTAFTRQDGTVVSFAKRLSALVFLYQQQEREADGEQEISAN
jgi:hypothetical protein